MNRPRDRTVCESSAICRRPATGGFVARSRLSYRQVDAPMTIDVAEEPMTALPEYAVLPNAFPVNQVLDVTARRGGRLLPVRKKA